MKLFFHLLFSDTSLIWKSHITKNHFKLNKISLRSFFLPLSIRSSHGISDIKVFLRQWFNILTWNLLLYCMLICYLLILCIHLLLFTITIMRTLFQCLWRSVLWLYNICSSIIFEWHLVRAGYYSVSFIWTPC